jgi:hypothetical protein
MGPIIGVGMADRIIAFQGATVYNQSLCRRACWLAKPATAVRIPTGLDDAWTNRRDSPPLMWLRS